MSVWVIQFILHRRELLFSFPSPFAFSPSSDKLTHDHYSSVGSLACVDLGDLAEDISFSDTTTPKKEAHPFISLLSRKEGMIQIVFSAGLTGLEPSVQKNATKK